MCNYPEAVTEIFLNDQCLLLDNRKKNDQVKWCRYTDSKTLFETPQRVNSTAHMNISTYLYHWFRIDRCFIAVLWFNMTVIGHMGFRIGCRQDVLLWRDRDLNTNRMMTSSNGNIFRVTGPLCGEFTGHRWILRTKASDAELYFFFNCALNKRLSKQWWGWWFETPSHPLWRHCNGLRYPDKAKTYTRYLVSMMSENSIHAA